jgi:hypothetical protein
MTNNRTSLDDLCESYCHNIAQMAIRCFNAPFNNDVFNISTVLDPGDARHCVIILETKHYRIKLITDGNTLESYVGSWNSVSGWDTHAKGVTEWFGLRNTVWMISGTPFPNDDTLSALGKRLFKNTLELNIEEVANMIFPVHSKVGMLFSNNDLSQIRSVFDKYYNQHR